MYCLFLFRGWNVEIVFPRFSSFFLCLISGKKYLWKLHLQLLIITENESREREMMHVIGWLSYMMHVHGVCLKKKIIIITCHLIHYDFSPFYLHSSICNLVFTPHSLATRYPFHELNISRKHFVILCFYCHFF